MTKFIIFLIATGLTFNAHTHIVEINGETLTLGPQDDLVKYAYKNAETAYPSRSEVDRADIVGMTFGGTVSKTNHRTWERLGYNISNFFLGIDEEAVINGHNVTIELKGPYSNMIIVNQEHRCSSLYIEENGQQLKCKLWYGTNEFALIDLNTGKINPMKDTHIDDSTRTGGVSKRAMIDAQTSPDQIGTVSASINQ